MASKPTKPEEFPWAERRAGSGDVKSALRVIHVLDLLGRWSGERTHLQIAEELNIPKSSLTQLLKTLVRHRYLAYDAESRGYALGLAIDELAARARTTRNMVDVAQPVLEWLTQETSESSALNYMDGDSHQVVATILSPLRIVAHLRLGDRAPLHATSGGQAMLAYLPAAQQEAYLKRARYESFAKNSLMDAGKVREKLVSIHEQGFSLVNEEFTVGICGIARPVFDQNGHPIASLNITVPVSRFTDALQKQGLKALEKAVLSLKHRVGLN